MADFRRRVWTMRNRPPIPRLIEEKITPSSGWTQYPEFHHLLVDLPGFGKDDIKFNVEESGIIAVSGRRRIREENKEVYFEKRFNVPEDGDIKSINTVFEGDTLKVSIPKVAKDMKEEPKKTNGASISSDANEENSEDLEKPASDSSKDTEEEKRKVDQSLIAKNGDTEEKVQQEYDESPASSSDTKRKQISADSLTASSSETMEEKKAEADEGLASSCYSKEGKQEPNSNSTLSSCDKTEAKAELRQSSEQCKIKDQKQNIGRDQGYETSTQGENSSSQTSVMVKIIENKGILIASILSFTLGVFLSQKFHPLPPPK